MLSTTTFRSFFESFITGTSCTFEYVRNTESSGMFGDFGKRFGQHIEPAGRYLNVKPSGFKATDKRWEVGTITFNSPLVLQFGGSYREQDNWKYVLSKMYGGLTGKKLSAKIKASGHDGIITMENGEPSEIVDISMF